MLSLLKIKSNPIIIIKKPPIFLIRGKCFLIKDIFLNNVFEANENITNGVAIPNKYRTINITLFPVSPDEPAKINIEANIGPTQGVQPRLKVKPRRKVENKLCSSPS